MQSNKHNPSKLSIRRGDTVKVIAGNYKNKTGRVISVFPKENRAIVEGINMVSRHLKPSANNPQGTIRRMEALIHISNLMLVDPSTNNPTRVGRKMDEAGKLQRYSKKTGELIKNV